MDSVCNVLTHDEHIEIEINFSYNILKYVSIYRIKLKIQISIILCNIYLI